MGVSIDELLKAADSLKISHKLLSDSVKNEPKNIDLHKALRDSCIQRFEFCVEMAWKTSVRTLVLQTRAPAPAVRDMAQNNLITNTDLWFDFLEARNKASHSYDEDIAKEVYFEITRFIPELDLLITKLKALPQSK